MSDSKLSEALWRIYRRQTRPLPWQTRDGNLPWDEPAFAARMLREHLDETHGAASRQAHERSAQLAWFWQQLGLAPENKVLDVTCGPGLYTVPLAERGCHVTAVDFSPAAITYARELAKQAGVGDRCTFILQDIREMTLPDNDYDAALLIYGQLAVMPTAGAQAVLRRIARALKPGGKLCLELLNPAQVDKTDSTWWFTDDTGLWGDEPFLHLGERFWLADTATSLERFHIVHLGTGALDSVELCDQTYTTEAIQALATAAGFSQVDVFPEGAGLPLYDAEEWTVYVATK